MSTSAGATLHVDGRCTGILVRHATTFWTRARGLWAEAVRQSAIALELRPCYAVHTFGMSGAIDIAFVDGEGRVLAACHRLKPWRVVVHPSAVSTWELPAGVGWSSSSRVLASRVSPSEPA